MQDCLKQSIKTISPGRGRFERTQHGKMHGGRRKHTCSWASGCLRVPAASEQKQVLQKGGIRDRREDWLEETEAGQVGESVFCAVVNIIFCRTWEPLNNVAHRNASSDFPASLWGTVREVQFHQSWKALTFLLRSCQ